MTLDFVILFAVLAFALFGAMSGFARQVGQVVALTAAFVAAVPGGRALGPTLARHLEASITVAVVLATVGAFILAYFLVRAAVTWLLRRMLAGKDPQNRGLDRLLGAALGGTKAATLAWLGLSAAVFLENNLVVAGRRYTLTPKDSRLVPLARRFNVVEQLQFSGLEDLGKALEVATTPSLASRLRDDPDYTALMKDPRFRNLANHQGLAKLLKAGDLRALLEDQRVWELLQDDRARQRLERLGAKRPQ